MQAGAAPVVVRAEASHGGRERLVGEQEREALLPARGQRPQERRHRRAVHQEAQAEHEARQHDHRERRVGRDELRGEDLRGAGEDDRAHAERGEPVGAGRRRADAADDAERRQADARREHLDEAVAKVPGGDELAHGKKKGEAPPSPSR